MTIAAMLIERGRREPPKLRLVQTLPAAAAHQFARGINADALGSSAGPGDPARAALTLQAIPVPEDRDQWLRIVLAAHAAGVAEADFLAWARNGTKYTTDAAELKAWHSYDRTRPGGISAATLLSPTAV